MATGSVFAPTLLIDLQVAPIIAITDMELAVPLSEVRVIAPAAGQIRLLLQNDEVGDLAPDNGNLIYVLHQP